MCKVVESGKAGKTVKLKMRFPGRKQGKFVQPLERQHSTVITDNRGLDGEFLGVVARLLPISYLSLFERHSRALPWGTLFLEQFD